MIIILPPGYSRGSKPVKGALVVLRSKSKKLIIDPDISPFIFQYNPETLTRTISSVNYKEPMQECEKNTDSDSIVQLINFVLELDVNDQGGQSNTHRDFVKKGVHPALAALESIMYSQTKNGNKKPPVVLFLWGPNRVLPIWLNNLKIIEETFDKNLNPIRARIELSMRVLSLSELENGSTEYAVYAKILEKRLALIRLYSGIVIDHEFIKQLPDSIQKHFSMEKPQSKKKNKKSGNKTV